MRRIFNIAVLVFALALVPDSASAQFDLSKVLGGLFGGSSKSTTTTTQDPYKKLAEAAPAVSTINGLWVYNSASFAYVGNNPLADVVIAQLDPIILDVLNQMGVVSGLATLKLDNGRAVVAQGESSLGCKYSYDRSKARVVVSAVIEQKSVSVTGYVKYASSTLSVMLDVKEVIKAVKTVYPDYKNDQNVVLIETLLKDMGDVYLVGKFKK